MIREELREAKAELGRLKAIEAAQQTERDPNTALN
jgi:hypothetical protein